MRWIVALFVFACVPSFAADTAADTTNTTSSRFDWLSTLKKVRGSYGVLFLGPTVSNIDGNIDGKGSYISMRNYLSLDMEVAKNWEAEAGWEVRQTFRPADPKNPNRKDFEPRDPFAGISRKNIIRGDRFSLGARTRFFLPVTEYNKSKVGKLEDAGNGEANLGISPSWKFLDGDLFVSCGTDIYYKFAENAPKVREDYAVKIKPLVSYRIASKFAAKVEYTTGTLRHSTNGKWTKLNDRFTGQRILAGGSWNPNKYLSLSPALGWGNLGTFQIKATELSLFATYYFL